MIDQANYLSQVLAMTESAVSGGHQEMRRNVMRHLHSELRAHKARDTYRHEDYEIERKLDAAETEAISDYDSEYSDGWRPWRASGRA